MNLKQESRNGSEKKSQIMILNYDIQSVSTLKKFKFKKKNKKDNDFTLSSETLRNP